MKKHWARQCKIELIILSAILLVCAAFLYLRKYGYFIAFIDTDDYMRVVRIREFFEHYDLSDNIIKRCNVPYGCSLHWTRFYDFFLIIPSYILSFFTDSTHNAIDYVCFCIGPIVRIASMIVLLKITLALMKRNDAFLCLALFAIHPIIVTIGGSFGRPDHHAFIMLFIILFLERIFSALKSDFEKHYVGAARISALCVWISPETLIPLLLTDGLLFLYALKQNKQENKTVLRFLFLKSIETAFNIGAIIFFTYPTARSDGWHTCGIVVVLFAMRFLRIFLKDKSNVIKEDFWLPLFFMFTIANLPKMIPTYYDEISAVHLALYMSAAYFFYVLIYNMTNRNILKVIAFSIVIICAFLTIYPKFLYGMEADVSPYVKKIWLRKVLEMKSPLIDGKHIFYIFHAIFTLIAAFSKSREIFLGKYANNRCEAFSWAIIIANSLAYLTLAGFANRMLLFSSLFSLPLLVELGMNSVYVSRISRICRIVVTFFITILFIFITVPENEKKDNRPKYTTRELFEELDKISSAPAVIMAHLDDGPNILYYTKHCAVGAPYHRQQEGIISSYKVMEAPYNENEVKKILKKTNSSYIFVRKYFICKTKKPSLPSMIITGNYPAWISIVKLPRKFDDIIVAKINSEKM